MSNLDKANSVAHEWVESMGGLEAIRHDHDSDLSGLIQALDDAGLLMPSLPEANDPGIFVPGGKGWRIGDISVWTAPDSSVMIQNVEPGDLSPTSAREYALTILAAADYAEKEQDNE